MASYDSVPQRNAQHIMVFGPPKSGKSTLIADLLLHGFNLTWFSIDNGHKVIGKLPAEARSRCNLIILPDTKEYPIAIKTCLKVITGAEVSICMMHGSIDCDYCKSQGLSFDSVCLNNFGPNDIAVFDTASQLADSAVNFWAKKLYDDEIKKGVPIGKRLFSSVDDVDYYKNEWDDWRVLGQLMNKFLGNVQNSRANIICTAQNIEARNESGQPKMVPRVGTRDFSVVSNSYFDHMVYTDVINKEHKAGSSTNYSISILTGSRSDVAVEKLDKPSLVPFFAESLVLADNQEFGQEHVAKILTPKPTVHINTAPVLASVTNTSAATPQAATPQSAVTNELLAKLRKGLK